MIEAGGQENIFVELDFTYEGLAGKDWAVVAYGEKGPVNVAHAGGWQSDSFPIIGKKGPPRLSPV